MKKTILIIAFVLLLCCASGCRERGSNAMRNQNGLITITTTIFPSYDFVRQIAGDKVNLSMLLLPGADAHSFESSPRDIISVQNSDIFIYIGGKVDRWVERILQSMNTDNIRILAMTNIVTTVIEEIAEGMEPDHHGCDHGHNRNVIGRAIQWILRLFARDRHCDHDHDPCGVVYDEHVWTSPRNAILIVRAITDLLCEVDSANAAFFQQNAAAYIIELEQLDAALSEVVANAKRRTIVFADRFPFRYLADDYGLSYFAAFPGCSTETEASAATVAFLINKIREEQIPVVFHIELSNERMANAISAETGAKKLLLHSCHNISRRDFDAGLGYLELMQRNVEALREALN